MGKQFDYDRYITGKEPGLPIRTKTDDSVAQSLVDNLQKSILRSFLMSPERVYNRVRMRTKKKGNASSLVAVLIVEQARGYTRFVIPGI
jgi:hypothetical protein